MEVSKKVEVKFGCLQSVAKVKKKSTLSRSFAYYVVAGYESKFASRFSAGVNKIVLPNKKFHYG